METVKLSLGRIKTFIACPLKYKLAYIDQVDGDKKPGAALSFYKSLHGALQYFHKRGTSQLPSLDDLMQLLDRNWASEGYRDQLEENQFKTQAQEILRRFYQDFSAAPPKVRYVDVTVSFQTRAASVSSRADRVDLLEDGTYEVINYKTGKNTLEPDELARDLQAAVLFQGANADKHLHGRVSKVGFYFLRANRKVSVTPTADDLKAANALIDQTVTSIARMTRPPTLLDKALRRHSPLEHPESLAEKGPLCSTCEYLAACPAWPVTPLTLSGDAPERFSERLRLSYSKLSSY
ncbi:MAG TPA: PD-(D/E)XK nuclease family protein, partial [bacterium]|nr:PD-(D/E)XK nuclease family protein [bacterium]